MPTATSPLVQTDSCSIWTQYSGDLELTGTVQDAAGNIISVETNI
jgi:hypothetical protein